MKITCLLNAVLSIERLLLHAQLQTLFVDKVWSRVFNGRWILRIELANWLAQLDGLINQYQIFSHFQKTAFGSIRDEMFE